METLRLRKIQQPSQMERLLEAFAARANIVPPEAYQIRDSTALPLALERVVAEGERDGRVWACWAHGSRLWLVSGEMSLARSRERGAPVLDIRIYGEDGELKDAGTWLPDHAGKWQRCAD